MLLSAPKAKGSQDVLPLAGSAAFVGMAKSKKGVLQSCKTNTARISSREGRLRNLTMLGLRRLRKRDGLLATYLLLLAAEASVPLYIYIYLSLSLSLSKCYICILFTYVYVCRIHISMKCHIHADMRQCSE